MGKKYEELLRRLKSREGRNVITFLVFLVLSAVLWVILALNEDTQRDLRCGVRITNVPDSLTRVSPIPEAINVSVRAKGSQLMKYWWHKAPTMTIDYRQYRSGNKILFSEASMKAFFRSIVGGGSAQILSVTPDSLSVTFTSQPGIKLPVKLDAHVVPAPQYVLVNKPRTLTDSVTLYSLNDVNTMLKSIHTKKIVLNDVRKSQVMRVPLVVPERSRAIPDSVDVSIEVEPLISKTRKVSVVPVNVPRGMKLIAVPSQVEVYYMVPMSIYKKSESDPKFRVEADYRTVTDSLSERIAVNLVYAPKDFTNVFLSTDSVDFILEQQ
ncbi:MAG: hypothetical protein LUD17_15580 [Bacteroidales bacterium]|nr:hypothetical protein [Bacteroidales bacterium]MCD8388280.1 hypothetical protein [Bacteroidales bacterium]